MPFIDLAAHPNWTLVGQSAAFIQQAYAKKTYQQAFLIYNLFGSVASHFTQVEPFLPIVAPPLPKEEGIRQQYLYEPSQDKLLDSLLPLFLHAQLYKALLESNAAEHGARLTTMHQATDNAEALLKALRIAYNKSRQAMITNEILEIAAGAEILTK